MSRRPSLKVAVGSPNNPLSCVWRLSVHEDEVYFGTRDAMPHFKASLHGSGEWHIAFTKPLNPNGKNAERFATKWQRPAEHRPGHTACLCVVVSHILPRRPFKNRPFLDPKVKWLPMPAPNRVLCLIVTIVRPEIIIDPRLYVLDKIIGHLKKANGENVCLLAHEREPTDLIVSKILEVFEKLKANVTHEIPESSPTVFRALLARSDFHVGPTNPPTIFDVGLGGDNVVVSPNEQTVSQ